MHEHKTLIRGCFKTENSPNEDSASVVEVIIVVDPDSDDSCRCSALATSIFRAKATKTKTSFATTTAITNDVNGPLAPISLMTAIADAGDLAIDNVAMREANVRVDDVEKELSMDPRRGMS
jgi:hypothetical protein